MKVIILSGGMGTRISEESHLKPKPMIEIGGKPIIWHIMKIYSFYGYNDFIICCGYKGYMIKEYFANYFLHQADVSINLAENKITIHNSNAEDWKITLVDTGLDTMTGGRLKRVEKYIDNNTFMLTYGDGVSNINLKKLVACHKKNRLIATVTAIQPTGRFGLLNLNKNNKVLGFTEKSKGDGNWINGGFFVLNKEIFKYLKDDTTILERDPMEKLSKMGELNAFKFNGFWQPMDTLRDKNLLEELWNNNKAPWKLWKK